MTQPIVLSDLARHSAILVLELERLDGDVARRIAGLARVAGEVGALDPAARLELGIGFGAKLWQELSPKASPRGAKDFTAIRGGGKFAPATQGDVVIVVQGERPDLVFEALMRVRRAIGSDARVIEEVSGFRYLDNRDLTGFIDGTGNPEPGERPEVALIGSDEKGFAGGSFVFASRWVHDLAAVARMAVPEREKMIGRTLAEGIELSDDVKPADAHNSRVEIMVDGEELAIYRKSFPYGSTSEHGLYFLAYTKDPSIVERMLARMYGKDEDGLSDRLLNVTRPVSGGFYFMPSASLLASIAG